MIRSGDHQSKVLVPCVHWEQADGEWSLKMPGVFGKFPRFNYFCYVVSLRGFFYFFFLNLQICSTRGDLTLREATRRELSS